MSAWQSPDGPTTGAAPISAGDGATTSAGPGPAAPEHVRGSAGQPSTLTTAAGAELDRLAELPLAEHPDVFARIHSDLQRALADIDDA